MADTPIIIVTANPGAEPTTRDRRRVNVQNVGTALCGFHVGETAPTSLDQCEILLDAATAVDKADGGFATLRLAAPLWFYFDGTGTKKAKLSPEI